MPILINDVVTEFEPQTREPTTAQSSTPSPATTGSAEINSVIEAVALQQARQQRLEVD